MIKRSFMVALTVIASLGGCSKAPEQVQMSYRAEAIVKADECHLCGMMIAGFAGPKGEVFEKGHQHARKFCSTRDMFSYYLQPENKRQAAQLFVHDMTQVPWDEPSDQQFIDAKSAWFVKGSSKRGAMGATLASFKDQAAAETFAAEFGGKVMTFDQIQLATLMD